LVEGVRTHSFGGFDFPILEMVETVLVEIFGELDAK
jgi:hypothetical protein